jgi:tetratricopeptide (TPR) repeat protein
MLDYAVLAKGDPAEYVSITQRIAQHDPGYFLALGDYFVAHKKEKEAVEAFENAFTHQADAVQLSNQCGWLVDYYATHNRTDRALEIARFAADVYSESGLQTMARLMERLGQPKEAEDYYLKIQERYGDKSPLPGFYHRQLSKVPNAEFAGKYAQMEKEVFPNKPHSVALSDFTAPPDHGVLIPVSNELLTRAGIKASDIVVAIDGTQVENFRQYRFILDLTLSDELDLIIYSGGKYQAVHATTPGRRFGIALQNYHR